jgi:hypothetical protein
VTLWCQSGGTAQFVGFFLGLQEVVRNHVDGASFITRRYEEEII